ncbi:MAG: choice-of-anchor A family protein, partial [Planctomycetes bacterium]|nr:choice-of-anchor A family protein [Planctomycetota bacterium]
MKSTVPPRLWCGIVPSTLALLALTSPAAAQLGGVKAPGKHNPTPAGGSQALGSGCGGGDTSGLLIPLDSTFNVVEFTEGFDLSGQPCYRNDDGYTAELSLQFDFEFFGQTYNSFYINNNGNISFGGGYQTYSATGFPIDNYPMIAPFWGDVDTTSSDDGAGVVYYRSDPNRLVITWDSVGYYWDQTDKQNTFQVILTDGSDPLIGLGNNVCFSYGDMQWTTGSASGGEGGFGGVPATVGANKGDGIDFFNVGRFDHPGDVYDGPEDANDGVDWLDNRVIAFNTGEENTPPIVVDSPEGCVSGLAGESITASFTVIGPEGDQSVDWSIVEDDFPQGADFDYGETISPGTTTVTITWNTTSYDVGEYWCQIQFTDNGNPPLTTSAEACFSVEGTEHDSALGEAGQFNVYSTRQLTIETSSVSGRIGAEKNFFISEASIATGDVPADVDSMASGRVVWAANGVLNNGNIVAELHLDHLEDTFYLANSTQEPRIDEEAWDHESMSEELMMSSATYGAMLPTGVVTEDGFGNLIMTGSGANPEIFLVTDQQLEDASHISVSADPDANVLINVEGGHVSPSNFGFEVHGTSANRILINLFEAWHVSFSNTNLNASLFAPESGVFVSNISVSGNIVGRWVELLNMDAQGDLLVGSIPSTNDFTYSLPMQSLEDTLAHNLVVLPLVLGDKVRVDREEVSGNDSFQVAFENSKTRSYRAEKVARITFGNGFKPEHVELADNLDLPVHFLEDGPLGGDDLISLRREGVDTSRRGVHLLELLENDLAGTSGINASSLRIVNAPQHGVVRTIPGTG